LRFVAVVAALLLVTGFLFWEYKLELTRQAAQTRQLADIRALVEKLAASSEAQFAEAPGRKKEIAGALEAAARGAAAGDTRLARALELLHEGKIAEDVMRPRETRSRNTMAPNESRPTM
jgi:hypothetical protein